MARTGDGRSTLVEIKAVDAAYPLFGSVVTNPIMPLPDLFAQKDGAFGAAVDPALLTRLDLKTGDRISIGNIAIELRAALTGEPDKLAGGLGLGPRLLISEAALRATGLLQPGSLVRWQYRLRLPPADSSDRAVTAVEKAAQAAFPDAGWEVRTRSKASPQLERNVERFTPIPDACRPDHAAGRRRRRRQRGRRASGAQARRHRHHEGARRFRRHGVRHLLRADGAGRAVRRLDRRRVWRRAALRDRLGVRRHHSAAGRAVAASGHAGAVDRVRAIDRFGLRAVAARPRPRYFGVDAVSRPDRRRAALAAPALRRRHGTDRRGTRRARGDDNLRPPHCRRFLSLPQSASS